MKGLTRCVQLLSAFGELYQLSDNDRFTVCFSGLVGNMLLEIVLVHIECSCIIYSCITHLFNRDKTNVCCMCCGKMVGGGPLHILC
jgi:hypothetical protein